MEKTTQIFTKALISLCFVLIIGCGNYEELKSEPSSSFDSVQTVTGLTFTDIKKDILEPNCISCHSGYADYNTVKSDLTKIVASVLTNRMPKNSAPLSDSEKSMLVSWQNDGAPLGDVVSEPIVDDEALVPTWESVSKNILQKKCTACHNPQGQAKFLPLSTRFEVFSQRDQLLNFKDPSSSYILEVIQDPFEPMPPFTSPFAAVTEEEIEVLTEWIRLGLP